MTENMKFRCAGYKKVSIFQITRLYLRKGSILLSTRLKPDTVLKIPYRHTYRKFMPKMLTAEEASHQSPRTWYLCNPNKHDKIG